MNPSTYDGIEYPLNKLLAALVEHDHEPGDWVGDEAEYHEHEAELMVEFELAVN